MATGKEPIDTSSPEFQNALSLIRHTHQSIFLTGKAGTGKSTFLRYICAHTKKKNVILAPTGIAAINAGGQTIHSFFKLPFHPLLPDDPKFSARNLKSTLKYNKQHVKLLQRLELIVIDEISMVRADIIDTIDRILRVYCGDMRTPFAGKQVLLIGDVFQLEPVVTADERDILSRFYPNAFFFSARVFREMRLVSIELTKVFRQQDPLFIRILDHIRAGRISPDELDLLNCRQDEDPTRPTKEENLGIVLATRRDTVDYINQTRLDEIDGDPVTLIGTIQGDFPANSLPTLKELEIKCGAQIIFVKNDPEKRWVNGTLGTVSAIDEENELLEIVTDEGQIVSVETEQWENIRYEYNEQEKKVEEHVLGVFRQFPIRLAWAITIHKSQGLTFRHVTIDFGGGTFAGGQAYVALSRCTSLDGLLLRQPITPADIFVRKEITQFATEFNRQQDVEQALQSARADIEYSAAAQAFDRGNMAQCLDHFFTAIHTNYIIEQPVPRRLLQKKLGTLNKMRRQRDEALQQMQEMQQRLKKYAEEYYQMGNECVTGARNAKAALANYAKAIELNPMHVEARVRMAVTLRGEGEYERALHQLEEAIALSPALFKAWLQKGRVLMDLRHWDLALSALQKARGLKNESILLHELLAQCHLKLMDTEAADLHLRIAKELRKKKGK